MAADGAKVAGSLAEAWRNPVVITMLAEDAAVEGVVFGDGGGLSTLGQGAVHISMSTISVALSDRLAEAHRKAGQIYIAAPVFGRPEAAAAAKLFIVAAGAEPAIARCQPLFDAMGQRTFIIGDKPSAANLVKISGNFLLATVIECLGEAFALIRKGGVDPHAYLEVLTSTLFSAPAYKTYGGLIADEQYEPAGFKMTLGLKDLRLALTAADALNVPMPAASLVHDHFLAGSFGAQYGQYSAGVVSVITKSGTNQWHGSLFEFNRNTDFNANSWQPAHNAAGQIIVGALPPQPVWRYRGRPDQEKRCVLLLQLWRLAPGHLKHLYGRHHAHRRRAPRRFYCRYLHRLYAQHGQNGGG